MMYPLSGWAVRGHLAGTSFAQEKAQDWTVKQKEKVT